MKYQLLQVRDLYLPSIEVNASVYMIPWVFPVILSHESLLLMMENRNSEPDSQILI